MSSLKLAQCTKSELDYFSPVPFQQDVLKTTEVCYNPVSTLDKTSTIEFRVPGDSETYRDLSNTTLHLKICVKNSRKLAKIKETDAEYKFQAVANLLHSLFRQCTIYLNNTIVSGGDSNYHYRAYLETILNYSVDTVSHNLNNVGWFYSEEGLKRITGNYGSLSYNAEGEYFIELIGKVRGDIINQPKYILNNIDMRFVFQKEKPDFYMIGDTDNDPADIEIREAYLYLNHVQLNPELMVAHQKILASGHNIPIMLKRLNVTQFTIPQGQQTLNLDNVVQGRLPNMLVFGLVDNAAYVGTRKTTPYSFDRNYLKTIQLVVNGISVPAKPLELTMELGNGKTVTSNAAYHKFLTEMGLLNGDKVPFITRERYDKDKCFLVAFDLTTDHAFNDQIMSNIAQGSIRIQGLFEKAIDKTLTAVVFTEYDGLIEIDQYRNVTNVL